jgi:hypothetical protein
MARWIMVLLLVASGPLKAADGSSGCGPAWYVLKENSLLSSFGRLVTNGFLTPFVSLGMTFGTSNCAKHNLVQKDQSSLDFAEKTFDLLRQDLARGEGDYLAGYMSTFGCSAQVTPLLTDDLRRAFARGLYASEEPVDLVITTRSLILASATREALCS